MEIFAPLRDSIDQVHFWRPTVPSVSFQPISLRHAHFETESVARFLDREVSKVVYKRMKDAPDSIIMLEAAADFTSYFLKIDDCVIPDIRNDVFGTEFQNISFDERSELSTAELLSPDSYYYWDTWKYYFDMLYRDVLSERIQRGIAVIFLSRRFCLHELKDGEFIPLNNGRDIVARNIFLDEIEDFISRYDGVKIVKSAAPLLFTSVNSPWGGPWEFHPGQAYYTDLRAKFLEILFPAANYGANYLSKWFAEVAQELSKTKSSLAIREHELCEIRNELERETNNNVKLTVKLDDAQRQSGELYNALQREAGRNEMLAAEQNSLKEELACTVVDLEYKISRLEFVLEFASNPYKKSRLDGSHREIFCSPI